MPVAATVKIIAPTDEQARSEGAVCGRHRGVRRRRDRGPVGRPGGDVPGLARRGSRWTPLRDRTGLPVIVTNDVTALAREQLWFGAGRTHSTFGIITVGAGLGVGVVREGVAVEELIDNGHLLAHAPVDSRGPRCSLGHRGVRRAYLNREDLERTRLGGRRPPGHPATTSSGLAPAATRPPPVGSTTPPGHSGTVVASFAGALQTTCIVLGGEDVAAFTDSPALQEAIEDRLRPGPLETQRCTLDILTTPLTFTDWARGAAVAGIQHVLGA